VLGTASAVFAGIAFTALTGDDAAVGCCIVDWVVVTKGAGFGAAEAEG